MFHTNCCYWVVPNISVENCKSGYREPATKNLEANNPGSTNALDFDVVLVLFSAIPVTTKHNSVWVVVGFF